MRYLLVALLFLAGCSNGTPDSLGLYLGQKVTVKKGFFKGCSGYVVQYDDYSFLEDDVVRLEQVTCSNSTANFIIVKVKDLLKD